MTGWMTLWTVLLIGAIAGFAGLLLSVGGGAIRELKETLNELRRDTQEADAHPEELDRAVE